MPEIEEECIFNSKSELVKFTTKTDGDTIIISGLSLTAEQAASLAWLVNQQALLKFKIKVKT